MNTGIYGFVAWIGTHLCYAVFLLWAYLPEHVLHGLGVTYYPSKYWAVAVPCHLLVSLAAVYLLYWFVNMMRLPPLESFHNILDEYRSTLIKVSPPLAAPQLGSCASSGRAWRLWAARHSQGEASPPGAQPLLLKLELAASNAADLTAVGHAVHRALVPGCEGPSIAVPLQRASRAVRGTQLSIYPSICRYSKDADDIPAWSQQGECIPPIYDLPIPSVNAVLYRRAPASPASPLAAGHAGPSAHGHGSFAAARPAALNALLGTERRQASLPSHMSSLG